MQGGWDRGNCRKFWITAAAVLPDSGNVCNISNLWIVKNGTNSTDRVVRTNGNYRLLWDAKADLGQVIYSNMVVRVSIDTFRDKVQLWKGGPYWATTNIGAKEPSESGYYFWWGDTVGYKRENDKWVASDGSSSNFSFAAGFAESAKSTSTYNKSITTLKSERWITADEVLAPAHDAAYVQWGGGWRMPTKQELADLNSKCDWTWVIWSGSDIKGYHVRGQGAYSSASIFLPAAGHGYGASLYNDGPFGGYWSSVPVSDGIDSWDLYFDSSGHRAGYIDRYRGLSVRPVQGFTE